MQVAEESADEVELVLRVEDLEVAGEFRVLVMDAQQFMADGVKGSDEQRPGGSVEGGLHALPHFARGLVGEGHGEYVSRLRDVILEQPGEPPDKNARLPGPGPRQNQRAAGPDDGVALAGVQGGEQGVHFFGENEF